MLDFTISLARQAGALLLDGLTRPRQVELKGPFDLVTNIDRASEALIVGAIRDQFPDHTVIAEEGGGVEHDSGWTWLIDPLDGTSNYAHGFPYFSVSLALLKDRVPFLGAVYDPGRDELFAAELGRGAWCNDRPIHVSSTPILASALVSTGFPYTFATDQDNNAAEFIRVHSRVRGIRRAGSAALDLCYVAISRLDAHWELRLKPWDSAAGALIVQEAGGRLSELSGEPWTPWSTDMLASNGHIHDEIRQVLNSKF